MPQKGPAFYLSLGCIGYLACPCLPLQKLDTKRGLSLWSVENSVNKLEDLTWLCLLDLKKTDIKVIPTVCCCPAQQYLEQGRRTNPSWG